MVSSLPTTVAHDTEYEWMLALSGGGRWRQCSAAGAVQALPGVTGPRLDVIVATTTHQPLDLHPSHQLGELGHGVELTACSSSAILADLGGVTLSV